MNRPEVNISSTPVEETKLPPLSKEEEEAVKVRVAEMRKLLASNMSKAKYKIEIRLMSKRSTWKPVPGFVSFWKSGNRLHGGGDEKVYICPGMKISKKSGDVIPCENLLSDDERTMKKLTLAEDVPGDIVCPECGKVWMMEQLIGEKFFNLTPQNWGTAMVRMFVMCGHDSDIVLKYSPDDIRSVAFQEQERQRGGELLTKVRDARKKRGAAIYRMANIFKDTSGGASLYSRFHAFITA